LLGPNQRQLAFTALAFHHGLDACNDDEGHDMAIASLYFLEIL